ncbi:MAG: hypothetical protein MUC78_09645 [Bacteroidales bacterium]|jgi:hypothetical protein|nr:hypothetical protein [Bacteroidales bacterium]
MKKIIVLMIAALAACASPDKKGVESGAGFIDEATIVSSIDGIRTSHPETDNFLLEKGIRHAASLWREEDGSAQQFTDFVATNYIASPQKRKEVFVKISSYFESLGGNLNEITLDLKKVLDESAGEIDEIDKMFGNYSVGSHVQSDFYSNKIAFVIALNFPYYTLAEKEALGEKWSREEWAMARLGDQFVSRVPAELNQAMAAASGNAAMYIAEYNIHMGKLRTDDNRQIFPDDMVLLSHWNLRDEIKASYADSENGSEKQEMIYRVMERIIRQEIPGKVVNSPDYEWAPFSNRVTKDGKEIQLESEPDTRYTQVVNIFNAHKAIDPYSPGMNTAILRKFAGEMEIDQEEIETLFDTYLSTPQLAALAEIIRQRLGRDLRPYDIWYDGFKSRSSIPESMLTEKTSTLYPDPAAFRKDMPAMLMKLGWSPDRAQYIADKIVVDPARGSGHAWGAAMKGSVSHLRTRISDKGMDYKGYNIAVHEFGHNVEQTISLYDVDYFMLSGVPNTGFTEATAFLFQDRDLMLLGIKEENPDREKLQMLDAAWSLMEIMGVGMVEMKVWKWLYENPETTPSLLKEQTISIAIEVWNKYFAPVMGNNDSPILAIYSHMIDVPLYLPNYSYGQIIQFQIEDYLEGKDFASEVDRMYKQGRLTPQHWMNGAVGTKISAQPVINALEEALK